MSLPVEWVDKIFLKLTLLYGRDFVGRWEGLSIADVKTDWGHELSGFEDWPEAIAYALANLPAGKPPTVLEFRDMARKAPRKALVELPGPPADPAKVAAELAKLAALTARKRDSTGRDEKAWAKRLQARHEAGDPLKPIQIRFYREALRLPVAGGVTA
jgi:hypothetical protein